MFNKIIASLCIPILLCGCATPSREVASFYVSVEEYDSYSCAQIAVELQAMQIRVEQLAVQLDHAAANDKIVLGIGLLVWPILFALNGTGNPEAQYAHIKGKHERMQELAERKQCPGSFALALNERQRHSQ